MLGELKAPDEYAAIIATEPLTNEEWNPMTPSMLYVFHNGDLLLTVNSNGPKLALDNLEHKALKTIRTVPHSVKLRDLGERARTTSQQSIQDYRDVEKQEPNKTTLKRHHTSRPSNGKILHKPRIRPLIDKNTNTMSFL